VNRSFTTVLHALAGPATKKIEQAMLNAAKARVMRWSAWPGRERASYDSGRMGFDSTKRTRNHEVAKHDDVIGWRIAASDSVIESDPRHLRDL